jgi:predicted phage-related endonuclease
MSAAVKQPIKGPEAGSEAWHDLRLFRADRSPQVIIGASEAAAACNMSHYSSALQLYLEKRGEWTKEFTPEQIKRMDLGKRLEPVILDLYADERECDLQRGLPLYFHPEHWWMAATPDAIGCRPKPGSTELMEWLVESKLTNWRMFDRSGESHTKFGEPGTDQVPIDYLFQAQQQMAVMGLTACEFPILNYPDQLSVYTVWRNDDLIEQLVSAELELSERIIAGDPPEPNWTHSGTKQVLSRMFGTNAGSVAALGDDEHELWLERDRLKKQIKANVDRCDEIDARIAWAMEDAEIGRFPDASIELKKINVSEAEVAAYTRKGYSYFKARKY